VSCLMGVLTLVPAWVLWDYLNKWAPVFDFLSTLP
jgi:hypothetical protein